MNAIYLSNNPAKALKLFYNFFSHCF